MALAVTHVILTIVALDIFRHYVFGLKKFPRYLLVIGGIAGLFPDIDIPLGWIISFISGSSISFHGHYTHTIFWPLLLVGVAGILHYKQNLKWARIFYVISAGWFLHLPLDCLHGGYSSFLWPLAINTKAWCPQWSINAYRHGIEAIILVVWLVHEELRKKIKDYI